MKTLKIQFINVNISVIPIMHVYIYRIQTEERNSTAKVQPHASLKSRLAGNRNAQIIVYAVLVSILFILSLLRSMNFFRVCMQTSVDLHQRLFIGVLRSPMSFFENNPMGRILNRFAKDIGIIGQS
jgi:ABC-type multidrug transport system fused ATPase/permease subunit